MIKSFKSYVQKSDSLLIFLVLEVVAFVCFGLGNAGVIFRYLGFLVSLLLIPYAVLFIEKKDILPVLIFAIPLVAFAIYMSFSQFNQNAFSTYINISIALGLVAFFFLGLAIRTIPSAKVDIILLVIGVSIAALVAISMLVTIFMYGPFYAAIDNGKNYFYNGDLFPIYKEARFLYGFSIEKVSLRYYGLFSSLLASSLCALLFISPKKSQKLFYCILLIGGLGVLSLLVIPYWTAFIYLIPAWIFALMLRFLRGSKKAHIALISIVSIIAFAILMFFIVDCVYVSNSTGLTDLINNNALLLKAFNNESYMKPINELLGYAIEGKYLFGFGSNMFVFNYIASIDSKVVELEFVKEGGFVALIIFLILLGAAIYLCINYVKKSKDESHVKVLIISFLLTLILYESFFGYDFSPLIHKDYYFQFVEQMPILIALFLLGYIAIPNRSHINEELLLKNEKVVEEVKDEK